MRGIQNIILADYLNISLINDSFKKKKIEYTIAGITIIGRGCHKNNQCITINTNEDSNQLNKSCCYSNLCNNADVKSISVRFFLFSWDCYCLN